MSDTLTLNSPGAYQPPFGAKDVNLAAGAMS
jgi:hypothetical protein